MTKQTKQVFAYSIKATALFTEEEQVLNVEKFAAKQAHEQAKAMIAKTEVLEEIEALEEIVTINKKIENNKGKKLEYIIASFRGVRVLKEEALTENKKIGQFESTFTRALGVATNETTKDFIVIDTTYEELTIQLITSGFILNGERYTVEFSSAGQLRVKKLVFVRESLKPMLTNKLYAGLTNERIGNIVINKLIAYKALSNSASIEWEEATGLKFNIDEVIVLPDFEHVIPGKEVEKIEDYIITKEVADLENPVTDGAGLILHSHFKQNVQFRSVFMKGLLTPVAWDKFAKENGVDLKAFKVKDVWGNEQSLKGIKMILTASQFKMYKKFDSWEQFKVAFKENECEFAVVNIESNKKEDFKDVKVSYQLLQTLYDMTDEELANITSFTRGKIERLIEAATTKKKVDKKLVAKSASELKGANKTLLEIAGVNSIYKRPIHKALNLTEEFLNDKYVQSKITDVRDSMIEKAQSGAITLEGSRSAYILPDVVAVMEWMFGLEIKGALAHNEVSCKLLASRIEVDMLRSPHLYFEHSINTNRADSKEFKYYTTNGVYVSINSTSSFELAYDVDGDTCILVPNLEQYRSSSTYVQVAKRILAKHDVKPLVYNMSKGKDIEVTPENTCDAILNAFKGNIGNVSNMITKLLNKDGELTQQDVDDIKLLKLKANEEIDFAKTAYRTVITDSAIKERLKGYDVAKVPYFFKVAKNKTSVAALNNSAMSRVFNSFKKASFGKLSYTGRKDFDYTLLMNDSKVETDSIITDRYKAITQKFALQAQGQISKQNKGSKNYATVSKIIEFYNVMMDGYEGKESYVVDVIIDYLYNIKGDASRLYMMWESEFGLVLLANVERNLVTRGKAIICSCGKVVNSGDNNKRTRCECCAAKAKKEKDAEAYIKRAKKVTF